MCPEDTENYATCWRFKTKLAILYSSSDTEKRQKATKHHFVERKTAAEPIFTSWRGNYSALICNQNRKTFVRLISHTAHSRSGKHHSPRSSLLLEKIKLRVNQTMKQNGCQLSFLATSTFPVCEFLMKTHGNRSVHSKWDKIPFLTTGTTLIGRPSFLASLVNRDSMQLSVWVIMKSTTSRFHRWNKLTAYFSLKAHSMRTADTKPWVAKKFAVRN